MGHTLYHLEIIRMRFIQSNDHEITSLLDFAGEQLARPLDEHESKYSLVFDDTIFKRIRSNPSLVTPLELERLLNFVEERIDICRNSDKGDKTFGKLDKDTYYSLEQKYTTIEKYILKLIIG